MLVTLSEVKNYCKVDNLSIYITEINTLLYFKYTGGVAASITLTTDTYLPSTLAAAIQALMRIEFEDDLITVAWSDITNKFTIATAEAAKTIQYINSNSTAGTYVGFTADSAISASIVSDSAIIDDTSLLDDFRSQVDAFIKRYTRRNIEATDYVGLYSFCCNSISLDDFPINSISVFTTNIDSALSLSNTDDFITIKYDGTTFTFSDGETVEKSDLTYIYDLVAAINAIGNGTTAIISNTDFNSLSIDRILKFDPIAVDCLYLKFYSYNSISYNSVPSTGTIITVQDMGTAYISYNAGNATVPEDIKLATLQIIKYMYDRWKDNSIGQEKFRVNDIYQFFEELPSQAALTLNAHRRVLC